MAGIVLLDGLRFFKGDMVVACQHQCHMGTAGGLVLDTNHLAPFEYGKASSAAANVDHNTVFDLIDGIGCCRLVQHIGHFKPRAFGHILMGLDAGFCTGRHGDGAVDQLPATQTGFQLFLETADDLQRTAVIHHYAVLEHAGRLFFTGNGIILLVQNHQDNIRRTQVHADLELVTHRLKGGGLRLLDTLHIGVDPFQIHHSIAILCHGGA